ncbi:MAG: hypothetical protein ACE5L7_01735 [Candidatus Aminicenantales bacterium]
MFFQDHDYRGAIQYILNHLEQSKEAANPVFSGLLAYSYSQLRNKSDGYRWLGEYLENYRGEEVIFDFLDQETYADILNYFTRWKEKYPFVSEIFLIESDAFQGPHPPDILVVGIKIEGDAYYKLSDEEGTIKGGLLKKGFNTIRINADRFFRKSGKHIFYMDLKAGDLIVRRQIEMDVRMDSSAIVEKKVKVEEKPIENPEFKISMYVGDELIVSSKKLSYDNLPLKLIFPPWPEDASPYGPVHRNKFALNSFSVVEAVGAIYELIKGFKKEKREHKRPEPIKKRMQVRASFLRKDEEGRAEEVRAVITLKTELVKVSPF